VPAPIIAITESEEESAVPYIEAVERAGGRWVRVNVNRPVDPAAVLAAAQGLLLTGGADVDPSYYGERPIPEAGVRPHPNRDANEMPLLRAALERDMPVLGICRGMQLLNVARGGRLVQDLPGHRAGPDGVTLKHDIFVPPGSKMTSILGMGGFLKVNSVHHQGIRWAQKAPNLMAGAYSLLKDGTLEALESPDHSWVVAVQFHPERALEVSKVWENLFTKFVAAAAERAA
jgi:putative glutamine amidotransferase